jgi:hypothetical protein
MKVYSVGCSFTSGTGVHHKNNYTSELGKLLRYDTMNYGEAGHSNQYIFRKVIELLKNWNNNDILLIQWTSPVRDEIITKEGHVFTSPFSDWCNYELLYGKDLANKLSELKINKDELDKKTISKYQNKVIEYSTNFFHHEYQLNLSFCFQYSLFGLLEKLGVKYIMFNGWDFESGWEFMRKKYKDKNLIHELTNEKYLKESFSDYTNTKENEHPDTNAHKMWADYLYQKIIELNYYTKTII